MSERPPLEATDGPGEHHTTKQPSQPKGQRLDLDAAELAALTARFASQQQSTHTALLKAIKDQLVEMNYYLRALAERNGIEFNDEAVGEAIRDG